MLDFEALMNAIMRRVERVVASMAQDRHATVEGVNPNDHTVRVRIQPEGILTGWIPLNSVAVGPAAIVCPASAGDQVIVSPAEGDADSWRVTSRVFDTTSPPQQGPTTGQPVQPGEIGIFAGSAYLHMSGGKVFLGGDLHVDGDIYDKLGKLDDLRQHYNQHKHRNVQPGGGLSGTTDQPDAE